MELLTEVAPLIGPRIDCIRTEDSLFISADLAGAKPQDVKLGISAGSIIISGVIPPLFDDFKQMLQQERFYGPFQRKIILPENCLTGNMKAELENGILTITIPF
ncbi:Hsp20/alpha crystallin family protein [Bacillus sp. FJAT-27445]|uniref:Hsp20/alpha crystallin family protein n=1 Tax=Bacillus sp. FJAT-27445 TaxID=1679166 RepID=UPI0012E390C0|nr:Hsp20/alpha crystallin family protein [Bacillus sp. FJAT-27445]